MLAGLAVYWNSLDAPFLWDDQTAILTNQTIRALWPPWTPLVPPLETSVAARPLVNASLALNYSLGGLDPRGYHAWNLGLHLSAAMLLFGVVRRTLEGDSLRGVIGGGAANIALVAALGWSIHPLVTEVVDYTTQRTTAMMGLFFLATLYCAIRSLGSRHRARWQLAAIVACAGGMASKEEMVVAPIIVALYDRVFAFSSVRDAWAVRKRLYWGLASTWVELAMLMWRWPRSTVAVGIADAWTYVLNQAQLVPQYLRLALWPDALVLDYGVPQTISTVDALGGAVVLAGLATASIIALRRWPGLGFLGAVFFLTLAPTSSIVSITSEVGAERRMYLPLAAISVAVVLAGRQLLARVRASWPSRAPIVTAAGLVLTAAWLGALGVRTIYRNAQYADPVALWQSSVQHRPHGRARMSYAMALITAGAHDEALRQLREAVRDYEPAQFALGVELSVAGDGAGAIEALDTYIAAFPANTNRIPARLLIGRLLFAAGRPEESAEHFRTVATVAPNNLDAQLSLGDVLLAQGQYAEAVFRYGAAVSAQPNRADWQLRLGVALAEAGELARAAEHFRVAAALDPSSELARSNLNRAVALLENR